MSTSLSAIVYFNTCCQLILSWEIPFLSFIVDFPQQPACNTAPCSISPSYHSAMKWSSGRMSGRNRSNQILNLRFVYMATVSWLQKLYSCTLIIIVYYIRPNRFPYFNSVALLSTEWQKRNNSSKFLCITVYQLYVTLLLQCCGSENKLCSYALWQVY